MAGSCEDMGGKKNWLVAPCTSPIQQGTRFKGGGGDRRRVILTCHYAAVYRVHHCTIQVHSSQCVQRYSSVLSEVRDMKQNRELCLRHTSNKSGRCPRPTFVCFYPFYTWSLQIDLYFIYGAADNSSSRSKKLTHTHNESLVVHHRVFFLKTPDEESPVSLRHRGMRYSALCITT